MLASNNLQVSRALRRHHDVQIGVEVRLSIKIELKFTTAAFYCERRRGGIAESYTLCSNREAQDPNAVRKIRGTVNIPPRPGKTLGSFRLPTQ